MHKQNDEVTGNFYPYICHARNIPENIDVNIKFEFRENNADIAIRPFYCGDRNEQNFPIQIICYELSFEKERLT